MEDKRYKSPIGKLLRFFEASRDGWKRKCKEGKVAIKRLTNRVGKLEKSRDRWRELARERQEQLERVRRELARQKRAA
jgi:hypothetical protein